MSVTTYSYELDVLAITDNDDSANERDKVIILHAMNRIARVGGNMVIAVNAVERSALRKSVLIAAETYAKSYGHVVDIKTNETDVIRISYSMPKERDKYPFPSSLTSCKTEQLLNSALEKVRRLIDIEIPIYNFELKVAVTEDAVPKHFPITTIDDLPKLPESALTEVNGDTRTFYIYYRELVDDNRLPVASVIAHESVHVAAAILEIVGIPIDVSTDEALAHLVAYLVEQQTVKINEYLNPNSEGEE